MWIIFLEAGLAVALLLLIVWVSLPRRKGKSGEQGDSDAHE